MVVITKLAEPIDSLLGFVSVDDDSELLVLVLVLFPAAAAAAACFRYTSSGAFRNGSSLLLGLSWCLLDFLLLLPDAFLLVFVLFSFSLISFLVFLRSLIYLKFICYIIWPFSWLNLDEFIHF